MQMFSKVLQYIKVLFFTVLLLVALFFQTQLPVVNAQSSSSSSSASNSIPNNSLSIKITKGTQSIFDNTLPVVVEVTSGVSADRLEMELSFSNAKVTSSQMSKRTFSSIKANDTKVYEYTLTPVTQGDTTAYFKAQLWQNDINLVQVEPLTLSFDNTLQIVPQTDEYKQNLKNWNTLKLFGLVLLLIVIVFIGYLLYRSTKVWLSKD